MLVRRKIRRWEELTTDRVLLHVLEFGMKILVNSQPKTLYPPRRGTDPSLLDELAKLQARGILDRVPSSRSCPIRGDLFATPKPDGGRRVIADLRSLNLIVDVPKHTEARWTAVLDFMRDDQIWWAATRTTRSGYTTLASTRCRRN